MHMRATDCENFDWMKKLVLSVVVFILVFWTVGCGEVKLDSGWKDREIVIDGYSDDWLDTLYYFENDNVSIGFFNDSDYLYACLLVEDFMIQSQVIRQGFTLWFDSAGGKEKRFGIKFPLGMQAMRRERMPMDQEKRPEWKEGERPDPQQMREAFEQGLKELEIVGPGKDELRRISVDEAKGLTVKVRNETGLLVYELRIPLRSADPDTFAIGTSAGALIGVGMEVPKMDMNKMKDMMGGRGRMPGGMPPEGGRPGGMTPGGRPGGMGGRGGTGMRGGMPNIPDGLKIWAKLQLSSPSE
ncbi:MAG: hypothetical protein JXB23_09895 [Candidatus Aminicenantes bacterium]|nr:hypothetical protein [Candidatus Aminicenantes bacterium]